MQTFKVVAAVLLFIVLAVGWRHWVDFPDEVEVTAVGEQTEAPAYRFRGVEVVGTDADGSRWKIEADEATVDSTGAMGQLSRVNAHFEGESGEVRAVAGSGRMLPGPAVELSDGVEIRWESFVATTPSARYHHGEGWVTSEEEVKLVSEGFSVQGRTMKVDVNGKTAHIGNDVHAVIGEWTR